MKAIQDTHLRRSVKKEQRDEEERGQHRGEVHLSEGTVILTSEGGLT